MRTTMTTRTMNMKQVRHSETCVTCCTDIVVFRVIDSQVCLSALHKFDEMCLAKNLSGYHAFSSMLSWNGKDLNPPICKDGDRLRKRFLVHLLSYIDNEAAHNIPDVARAMISSIRKC
ncbi:hypothetical protein D1007_24757 [Hordeum vulgare]|nr:hypothetical protein D1007_24757 [Hordeum vulgare]